MATVLQVKNQIQEIETEIKDLRSTYFSLSNELKKINNKITNLDVMRKLSTTLSVEDKNKIVAKKKFLLEEVLDYERDLAKLKVQIEALREQKNNLRYVNNIEYKKPIVNKWENVRKPTICK